MKDGESSMEQTEILLTIQRQLTMLQSTIDTLREQSRQKDEEIERLRQIILNLQRPIRTSQREADVHPGRWESAAQPVRHAGEIGGEVQPGTLAESGEGNLRLRSQPEEKAHAGRTLCDAAGGRENRESESEASC